MTEAFINSKYFQSGDEPYTDIDFALSSSGTPVPPDVVAMVKDPAIFKELYWGVASLGVMPEDLLTKHGVPFDVRPNGQPYVRDEGRLPLSQRRHVHLTSEQALAELVDGYRSASSAAEFKHNLESAKVRGVLAANAKCESDVEARMLSRTGVTCPHPFGSSYALGL